MKSLLLVSLVACFLVAIYCTQVEGKEQLGEKTDYQHQKQKYYDGKQNKNPNTKPKPVQKHATLDIPEEEALIQADAPVEPIAKKDKSEVQPEEKRRHRHTQRKEVQNLEPISDEQISEPVVEQLTKTQKAVEEPESLKESPKKEKTVAAADEKQPTETKAKKQKSPKKVQKVETKTTKDESVKASGNRKAPVDGSKTSKTKNDKQKHQKSQKSSKQSNKKSKDPKKQKANKSGKSEKKSKAGNKGGKN